MILPFQLLFQVLLIFSKTQKTFWSPLEKSSAPFLRGREDGYVDESASLLLKPALEERKLIGPEMSYIQKEVFTNIDF